MEYQNQTNITSMDFKLERYKFLNNQINILNLNVQKYLNQFQTIMIAIIIASVYIILHYKQFEIPKEIANISIRSLCYLSIGLSIFIALRILAGLFSWWDYRNEEVRLLNEEVEPNYRRKPTMANIWRWDEIYSLIIILVIPLIFKYLIDAYFITLIK